jgi:hypothetical protein
MESLLGASSAAAAAATVLPAPPIFSVEVGQHVGADAVPLANDVLRMVCIQLAIQVMLALSDPSGAKGILTTEFFLLLTYISLGAMLYWLVVRKLFVFV